MDPESSLLSPSTVNGAKKRAHTTAAVDPEMSLTPSAVANVKKLADITTAVDPETSLTQHSPAANSKKRTESASHTVSAFQFPAPGDASPGGRHRTRASTDGSAGGSSPSNRLRAWSFGSNRYKHKREPSTDEDVVDGGGNVGGFNRINRRSVSGCGVSMCHTPLSPHMPRPLSSTPPSAHHIPRPSLI